MARNMVSDPPAVNQHVNGMDEDELRTRNEALQAKVVRCIQLVCSRLGKPIASQDLSYLALQPVHG